MPPRSAKGHYHTTTTNWFTTKTTIIADGTMGLAESAQLKTSSKQSLAVHPWRHPQPGVRPGECPSRFVAPPQAPHYATELNGISLPDACFNHSGPHHVFVLGDWGGVLGDRGDRPIPADRRSKHMPSHHRPFVVGADDRAQQNVAKQMQKRSAIYSPDYILNMGDNFYWGGVLVKCGGPAFSVEDASGQWEWVFERVYDFKGIEGKQWLGVLGNHDYGGFMFTHGWDQAIGYTWTKGHPSRGRWVTPAQYWSVKVHYPTFSIDYYFVDTNPWDAFEPHADPGHNLCSRKHNLPRGATCGAQGPVSVEECPAWFDRLWEAQVRWLEKGLAVSTADWQIVVTHFPPEHGLMDWKRLTSTFGVDLLVTGHRHQQEVHHLEETNFLRPTSYIVSGGGGGITSEGLPSADGEDDQYGFMHLTLSKHEIMIEAISHGGQLRSTTCLRQVFHGAKLAGEVPNSWCEAAKKRRKHPPKEKNPREYVQEHYDCSQGRSSWQMLWSFAKINWCCEHEKICMGAFNKEGPRQTQPQPAPQPQPQPRPQPHPHTTHATTEGTTSTETHRSSSTQASTTTETHQTTTARTTTSQRPSTSSSSLPPSSSSSSTTVEKAADEERQEDSSTTSSMQHPPANHPQPAPGQAPASTPAVVPVSPTGTQEPESGSAFDCLAGYYNLENEWSQEKRFWCCIHEKLGCNHLHNCNPDDVNNPITSWSYDKMQYCCDTYGVSCVPTAAPAGSGSDEALYNCNPDRPGNAIKHWSQVQTEYCCSNFEIGCDTAESQQPPPTPRHVAHDSRFDCQADLLDWELMWSVAKQEWCCRHEQLGCTQFEDCDYNDGDNLYSSWSLSKKEWCCMHWGVRCSEISSGVNFKQLWLHGMQTDSWRPRVPELLRRAPLLCSTAGVAGLASLAVIARKAYRRHSESVRGMRVTGLPDEWEEFLMVE